MKLGRPVRITRNPFRAPMPRARTSETRIMATQTLRPYSRHHDADRQAGEPGHRAGRQVELAADHQQGDGDGHDADASRPKSQVLAPLGVANASVVTAKKTKMTMRRDERRRPRAACRSRAGDGDGLANRSSGGAACGWWRSVLMVLLPGGGRPGPRSAAGAGRPTRRRSAGAVLGELGDRVGVVLGDEGRAGVDRLAATDVVAVDALQVEPGDAQVALDVGLLVDREQELAVLDVRRSRPRSGRTCATLASLPDSSTAATASTPYCRHRA